MPKTSRQHLSAQSQINLGSYYTPQHLVELAQGIIKKHVSDTSTFALADTSCGYGSFLQASGFKQIIGADIDPQAITKARDNHPNAQFYLNNSLQNTSRSALKLTDADRLIIVGNPPYNDTSSMIRRKIKRQSQSPAIDPSIKTRDFGISFLLSYDKLAADYICVLHPLSYLIKKTNFALLKNFALNYRLIDGLIISSHEFPDTSRSMAFPIIIALYKRDPAGMSYRHILEYNFKVKDGGHFRLAKLDTIANYIQKYPNRKSLTEPPVAKFWTMRDINALKRNQTFIDKDLANAVYIPASQLPYYCYVDVFKHYASKMPYFIGNCDVIIDDAEFQKIRDCFVYQSVQTNPVLAKSFSYHKVPNAKLQIEKYFKKLLTNNFGEEYAADFN